MYAALASVALGSAAMWSTAAACTYTEHPSSVMYANDALRIPIAAGAEAQNECAATAQAFGLTIASIVPGAEGSGSECVLFGAPANATACVTYEVLAGAITLSEIAACDATKVQTVVDGAVALEGSGEEALIGTATTATKLTNTAAVGKAVHSDLSFVTEEECVVACSEYIASCTHVTSVVAQGQMVKCSFHGSPTQGVEVQGASTYYNIAPSPQLATRTLAGGQTAVAPGAVAPVATATPAPALAPTIVPVPAVAVAPVPAVAPLEPALGPAVLPETGAPIAAPAGGIEALVYSAPGMCPNVAITSVPADIHRTTLDPPDKVDISIYTDVLADNGEFPMPYNEIPVGGSYCVAKGSTNPTVTVGGMFFWEADGECVAPPATATGEACCEVFMWQPNSDGFYYENCSMKMKIQPNGLYYFETEMPGDESEQGWGPDPEPHIHYDIMCTGCADHAVVDGEYHYWNKFYPEDLCTIDGCGVQGPEHQAIELEAGGQALYKYDFVLPAEIRTDNSAAK